VTVAFSILELSVDLLIEILLYPTDIKIGQHVTKEMRNFQQKAKLAKSLQRSFESNNKVNEHICGLIENAEQVAVKRNDIIHSLWSIEGPDGLFQPGKAIRTNRKMHPKRGMVRHDAEVAAEDLTRLADEISQLAIEIYDYPIGYALDKSQAAIRWA
jgi:hypothetical protein